MRKRILTLLVASASLVTLPGCAAVRNTAEVATDYNRSFADSRNEMLLLNILRAGEREPLQFSAMGTVTGGVRNSGSLRLPFAGLINGEELSISPELTINDGVNPQITVVPLAEKGFTTGILRQVQPEAIDLFLSQGVGREIVLPLLIGGVVCSEEDVLVIDGGADDTDEAFQLSLDVAFAKHFTLGTSAAEEGESVILPAKDAMAVLKEGLGDKYTAKILKTSKLRKDQLSLKVSPKPATVFQKFNLENVCRKAFPYSFTSPPRNQQRRLEKLERSATTVETEGGIGAILRSPASIVGYLGNLRKSLYKGDDCRGVPPARFPFVIPQDFVRIYSCAGKPPHSAAVSTYFRGKHYYIPADAKHTLQALSLLSDLIALQTSESTIAATSPVIAITQP